MKLFDVESLQEIQAALIIPPSGAEWSKLSSVVAVPIPLMPWQLLASDYRHAVQIAKWLYHHFKKRGVPSFVINRISSRIRPIVIDILEYNGVTVRK